MSDTVMRPQIESPEPNELLDLDVVSDHPSASQDRLLVRIRPELSCAKLYAGVIGRLLPEGDPATVRLERADGRLIPSDSTTIASQGLVFGESIRLTCMDLKLVAPADAGAYPIMAAVLTTNSNLTEPGTGAAPPAAMSASRIEVSLLSEDGTTGSRVTLPTNAAAGAFVPRLVELMGLKPGEYRLYHKNANHPGSWRPIRDNETLLAAGVISNDVLQLRLDVGALGPVEIFITQSDVELSRIPSFPSVIHGNGWKALSPWQQTVIVFSVVAFATMLVLMFVAK